MIPSCRLDLPIDLEGLRADYEVIRSATWLPHFNTGVYSGDWSGIALRAPAGDAESIYPDPAATDASYQDTPLLAHCPNIRTVLEQFGSAVRSVRLLRLAPGAVIKEHRDHALSFEENEVRLHVPIVTNPDVVFTSDGEQLTMQAGECWYINASLRHSAANLGSEERIHLVIDCVVTEWLRSLLIAAGTRMPDHEALVDRIVSFVRSIGISVEFGEVGSETVLPGICIRQGGLLIDRASLLYPGDILHEAGHLAVAPPAIRLAMDGAIDPTVDLEHAGELMTLPWSYAAALHLGIDPAVVFHPYGYHGASESLLSNFNAGHYIGLPMLEWTGMILRPDEAMASGREPFPHMVRWVREE